MVLLQVSSDGVYAGTVLRLKEASLFAERLGEVAGYAGQLIELDESVRQFFCVDFVGISLDEALGQDLAVAGDVGRREVQPPPLELLRHSRRAGEQVESRCSFDGSGNVAEHGDECSLRTQVLDHGDLLRLTLDRPSGRTVATRVGGPPPRRGANPIWVQRRVASI